MFDPNKILGDKSVDEKHLLLLDVDYELKRELRATKNYIYKFYDKFKPLNVFWISI